MSKFGIHDILTFKKALGPCLTNFFSHIFLMLLSPAVNFPVNKVGDVNTGKELREDKE